MQDMFHIFWLKEGQAHFGEIAGKQMGGKNEESCAGAKAAVRSCMHAQKGRDWYWYGTTK